MDDDVQFTAFRPTRVRPDEWYQLLLFVHKGSVYIGADGEQKDPLAEVAHQANALLGLARPEYADVRSESIAALSRGTALTLVPWVEKGQVNPGSVRLDWYEPVHRHEFRLRLPRAAEGERVSGGVRIFRDLLLIGEVRFSITVDPAAPVPGGPGVPTRAVRYRKIFASYSRRDHDIVRVLASHVETTGDRYLLDVQALRSGETWNDRLMSLIEEADVFQLFWSTSSMRSTFVRQEWEHALQLGRNDFVRPVYWEDPLPADPALGLPPDTLAALHFCRLPHPATAVQESMDMLARSSSSQMERWSSPHINIRPMSQGKSATVRRIMIAVAVVVVIAVAILIATTTR